MALRRLGNTKNMTDEEIKEKLGKIKCFLLDMDGTITLGEEMLPGAEKFFENIGKKQYIFVTNNSSHSSGHYLKRLERLGIKATRERLVISTDALIENVKDIFSGKDEINCFVIGTPDFESEIEKSGINLIYKKGLNPDAVLVGFDTTLTYEKLDIACDYIRSGIPYYAANPDKVCPLNNGLVLPDCGAIIAFLETCTDIRPVRIYGKPDNAMIDMVRRKYGFENHEMAMVGDRIYTDLFFAQNAGIIGIGVLTGEAGFEEISLQESPPDFVFEKIQDICEYI
jgi:HAD superfamily hydrolase (TIGR01450 family)